MEEPTVFTLARDLDLWCFQRMAILSARLTCGLGGRAMSAPYRQVSAFLAVIGDAQEILLLRLQHELLSEHRVRIRNEHSRMRAESLEDPAARVDLLHVAAASAVDSADAF